MPTKALSIHQRRPTPEARPNAAQRGYDSAWRRFRAWFLRQPENILCAFRDDPRHADECTLASEIVDHVKPLAQGGARLDRNNCRGVCRVAHDRITANLNATGRNELPQGN